MWAMHLTLALALAAQATMYAQTSDPVTLATDSAQLQPLANHHPQWAAAANDAGALAADQLLDHLTLVLSRSPQKEAAFDQFLAAQQDPTSPEYHHWLTPTEVGERFGLSASEIATLTTWLESQDLHVNWVSPSRIFISFGGRAAEISRAFQTELHSYKVNGGERFSVSSAPLIPRSLAPSIKAIHGLYTIEDRPAHHFTVEQSDAPQMTLSSGKHFITPEDFATIYDLPSSSANFADTVGIVGRSRINFHDYEHFEEMFMDGIAPYMEVIPTTFGGKDPGPALTTPPANGTSIADQSEATLDVEIAGGITNFSDILLVAATKASGGIETDAQYLVQTSPLPARIMSISFGECESAAGPAGVHFWDTLFKQAAAEGISVFVASGDSGASGCDQAFATPPNSSKQNSPNYICSSSYATCVGGTEFNDTSDASLYWGSGTGMTTAQSYIPEGGWNEPLNSSNALQVAASGGGVSSIIPTPSWQKGTGVPTARIGRYTPDISFSASCHDGYFGCFAAGGGSCLIDANGSYRFIGFCGTSAATPSMAGIASLLDGSLQYGQGNLNPELYRLAQNSPTVFHDVTAVTSGVANCQRGTPSLCNNSIPSPSGLRGGQAGYLVTAGFDQVTGLGSLDVQKFFAHHVGIKISPAVAVTAKLSKVTTAQQLPVQVSVTGRGDDEPSGSVTLRGGSYTSTFQTMSGYVYQIYIPAGTLTPGKDTLTATYTPDASSSGVYNSATGSATITVTAVPIILPTVTVALSASKILSAGGLTATVGVNGGSGNQAPSGTVTLTGGGYSSGPVALSAGSAAISIAGNSLAAGVDKLTANYMPDKASVSIYKSATGSNSVSVTAGKITPTVSLTLSTTKITTAQGLQVAVTVDGGSGNQTASGTIQLSSGKYLSAPITLSPYCAWYSSPCVVFNIPADSLPAGTDKLIATYTPDKPSAPLYNSASASSNVTVKAVAKITPVMTLSLSNANITTAQPLWVTITVNGGSGNQTATGSVTLASGKYSSGPAKLANGNAMIHILADSLKPGADKLTVSYTPDATSASIYNSSSASSTVTVTAVAKITPSINVWPGGSITTAQALWVTVEVGFGDNAQTPTGAVKLSCGKYASAGVELDGVGNATIIVPSGSLPVGTDTLTITYTPDKISSSIYNSATGTASVTVTAAPVAATPKISPSGGKYASSQKIAISDSASGAVLYYTTNGSVPTRNSTRYTAAITVSTSETVKALAVASGFSNSAVATATYTLPKAK
jgi:subtilase family serine protease